MDWILQARILEWVAFSSPGDLLNPRIKLGLPALQAYSLPTELSRKLLPKNDKCYIGRRKVIMGLPRWCSGKASVYWCRRCKRCVFNPWVRKIFPGVGNGSSLLYSCLENSMGRGALWTVVHRVSNSWTRLSDWACTHTAARKLIWQPDEMEDTNHFCCS